MSKIENFDEMDSIVTSSGLCKIEVEKSNKYFASEDGVLFDKTKTVLVKYPPDRPAYIYVIPNTVKYIENAAFANCWQLQEIVIPDGVVDIGDYAFAGCENIRSFKIPSSVEHIGKHAFETNQKFRI